MSRSIHTTRKSLSALKRKKFSSAEARKDAIREAEADLSRKRKIKNQVYAERHEQPVAGQKTDLLSISVEVLDHGPNVHHAIAEEDIRSIFGLLPTEAYEGIEAIRLALGLEYMQQCQKDHGGKPDPYTGRLGSSSFPGVYSGTILGTFRPSRGWVTVYAYVVDQAKLSIPRVVCDMYLRLQALKTFVHEIAHYHDRTARVSRGRWLADRKENLEWYAEKMEHQWTQEIVIPYLEKRYARECRMFKKWVEQKGGIPLGIGAFAGDTRHTERNGWTRLVCSTAGAFETWIEKLPLYSNRDDANLELAWQLHYSDQYAECLQIVEGILRRTSEHLKARECRADTLVHLERLDDALADADVLLNADPSSDVGWETHADVQESRAQWSDLLETCSRWKAYPKKTKPVLRNIFRYQAIACCALGHGEAMEESIQAHLRLVRFKDDLSARRRAYYFRKSTYRRAKRPIPPELSGDFKP